MMSMSGRRVDGMGELPALPPVLGALVTSTSDLQCPHPEDHKLISSASNHTNVAPRARGWYGGEIVVIFGAADVPAASIRSACGILRLRRSCSARPKRRSRGCPPRR